MPRIARLKLKGEPAVYHVMSRTALDGFVLGYVEKEYLFDLIKRLKGEIKNLVTMLVRQLNLLDKRISILFEQLETLKGRLDLALQAFDEGLISIDRVYDARDALVQGQKIRIQSLYEYHLHLSTIEALMGKGMGSSQNN